VANFIPEAYSAVRPIIEISVWNINQESAAHMVADLSNKGFSASFQNDLEEDRTWITVGLGAES